MPGSSPAAFARAAKGGEFEGRIIDLFAKMTDLMVADSSKAGCRLENPHSVPNLHERFKKRLLEMLRGVEERRKRVLKAEGGSR